ncbi:AraC family transcriptional regulator [Pseudoxanthomonas sacheonensis]|uniref:AraC family transcriptional regulator n=1 Tax=Pseudoxanthomonas sacheonensis TaxID=443615 RepID=UPI001BA61EEE|nr:AraC family transcriptional regulator [Pseudoxanthomonas sacheonensis]
MRITSDPANETRLAAAVIPTNMLCHLVQLAREQGMDSTPWFKGMRLDPQEIDDPATRVSYRQASEIVARALAALAQPDLGLQVGCRQNVGNFGLLGLAMKTAPTFGEAVLLGMTYQRTTGAMLDIDTETSTDGEVAMTARAPVVVPAILPFLCEEMFASSLMVARELIGPQFRPLRLELVYPAPTYADKYAELFQCELHFDRPRNLMVIDSQWMALEFPTYNAVNARQVLELCQRQLADIASPQSELSATVERFLRQHVRENPPLSAIAGVMHLSERTLRRQLAADGISFSRLHDRIRTERALELLHDHNLTISQVGTSIGFADAREFRRAFKRWTGHTPSEAREQMA